MSEPFFPFFDGNLFSLDITCVYSLFLFGVSTRLTESGGRRAILGGDRGVICAGGVVSAGGVSQRRVGIIVSRGVGRVRGIIVSRSVARARVLVCRAEVRVDAVVLCVVCVWRLAVFSLTRFEGRTTERTSGVAARYARLAHDLRAAPQDPCIRGHGDV
jgi:hypothetical protein